jgi:hypothetical protein
MANSPLLRFPRPFLPLNRPITLRTHHNLLINASRHRKLKPAVGMPIAMATRHYGRPFQLVDLSSAHFARTRKSRFTAQAKGTEKFEGHVVVGADEDVSEKGDR